MFIIARELSENNPRTLYETSSLVSSVQYPGVVHSNVLPYGIPEILQTFFGRKHVYAIESVGSTSTDSILVKNTSEQ